MSTADSDTRAELERRERLLVEEVLASFADTPDARVRQLVEGLVTHLHDYAREVRLTEKEWEYAIDFLTRTGHITDDRRQEFILLSDVLGLSMLTIGISAPTDVKATEPTVFGPFFVHAAPRIEWGGDAAQGAKGEPCWIDGQVTDTDGTPIAAEIEVWETDDTGHYDVQYDDGRTSGRAKLSTDQNGRYGFWGVKPVPYPIPHDGPVGDLLAVTRRSPMRPAHIHFMVSSSGHHTLVTHVFSSDSDHLDGDAVFGVKRSLIKEFERREERAAPAGRTMDSPWWHLRFDIRLAKEEAR
jgi:hydroxyquinol 1,2-dioxygenase